MPRTAVNWRSVLLGLAGVVFICSLTAYNDYVLNNTLLVGNFLPIGLLLFFSVFLLLVNGPLCKWVPHRALSSGELAVSLGMVLVCCGVASSGLIRYVPTTLIGIWYHSGQVPDYQRALLELNLPNWMFPRFESPDQTTWLNDRVVTNFFMRSPAGEGVPWGAWLQPLMTWGIFLGALITAIMCLAVIVRRQWAENERLPFPLADVYTSLIESPQPGRALNSLLSSRVFWGALAAVFFIHAINALHLYFPKNVPEIPIKYDLTSLKEGNAPWWYMDWASPKNTLYFSIIGIVFFVQSNVAFSLWIFYVLFNVVCIIYGLSQSSFSQGMQAEQTFGASMVYALALLWVGRAHWAMVARQMVRGPQPGEPVGRYLSLPVAGWGLVISLAVMIGWLKVAGASVVGAVVLVLMLVLLLLVMARIVAETGLIFITSWVPLGRPWVLLGSLPDGLAVRTTGRSYFFATLLSGMFSDTRESLAVFSTHALRVSDKTIYEDRSDGRIKAGPIMAVLGLSIVVAFFVAGTRLLQIEYAHASTVDRNQLSPINGWAIGDNIRWNILDQARDYRPPKAGPSEPHNRLAYFTSGAAIAALLSFLRLRFVGWPLHPIGFLVVYSWPIKMMWFSVFLGWIAKVLIVRFGGVELMRKMRPLFLGMIVGEAGSAAFWLVVSLVLHSMGMEYHAVILLPQ